MANKNLMLYAKHSIILLGIVCAMYLLFLHGLSLHKTANRTHSYSLKADDKKELIVQLASVSDETEIIKQCNAYACSKLSFHKRNNLMNGEANCVGYAQYSAALLNYAFSQKKLSSKARPVVGQIHLYGFNLHPLALAILPDNLKSFFKDHDFVEIIKEDRDTIFIDTSIQDLTGKSFL